MIDALFTIVRNKFVMPFVLITALLMSVFVYAGLVGWKFFGKTTENWSPEGHTARRHSSHTHVRTHK